MAAAALTGLSARAQDIAIANYNIEADIGGYTTPRPGLAAVIEAIGQQTVAGVEQPVDILGLEETTSNTTTVAPLVASLNSYYGAGTYAYASYQGTEEGNDPTDGNGPNAMIYDTQVVTLVAAIGVPGTPSNTGIDRQVVRYEFQGVAGGSVFYVYVSHAKSSSSGTTAADQTDRNNEALAIRANEATLPANSSVIYMGDFNLDNSSEPAYMTLTATGTPGAGVDPLNPTNNYNETWTGSAYQGTFTDSDTSLKYRDDIQFQTSNVYNDTSSALNYIAGTYRAFGNNGTTASGAKTDLSTNTALNNVAGGSAYQQTILADLVTASDHLPVVADYSLGIPEPSTDALLGCGMAMLILWVRRSRIFPRDLR